MENIIEEPSGKIPTLPPIIKTNFCSTPDSAILVFVSCKLDRSKKQSSGMVLKKVADKEGIVSSNKSKSSNFVFDDQFTVRTTGLLSNWIWTSGPQ